MKKHVLNIFQLLRVLRCQVSKLEIYLDFTKLDCLWGPYVVDVKKGHAQGSSPVIVVPLMIWDVNVALSRGPGCDREGQVLFLAFMTPWCYEKEA